MLASLPLCLVMLMAGIVLAGYLPLAVHWVWVAALFGLFLLFRRFRGGLPVFCLVLGLSLSMLQEAGPASLKQFQLPSSPLSIEGTVDRIQLRHGQRWRAELSGVSACGSQACSRIPGGVWIYGEGEPPSATPGDRIHGWTRLKRPRNFGTPGEFNWQRYLAAHRVYWTGWVSDGLHLAVEPGELRFPAVETWRSRLVSWIDRSVPTNQAVLLRALLVGDQGGVNPDLRTVLGKGGVAHLFAISGLHVGLVAVLLYSLLVRLYAFSSTLLRWQPPQRVLPLFLLPFLMFYLLLAGSGIAAQRALLVVALMAFLGVFSRSISSLRLLAAVAFLLLSIQPLQLFSPGFQLTFAGAGGIVWLWPCMSRPLLATPLWIRGPLSLAGVTLVATLSTAPLVAWHFHQVSVLGLVINLWALPIVSFVAVPLGLLSLSLYPFWTGGALSVLRGCGWVLEQLMISVNWAVETYSGWVWDVWPSALHLWAGGAVILLAWWVGRRGGIIKPLLVFFCAGCLAFAPRSDERLSLRLTAFSVGQGDAYLLQTGGHSWLVDGGGRHRSTFDVGERLVVPALKRLGLRSLDGVVLTHRHPDHWLGLVSVLSRWPETNFFAADPWFRQPSLLAGALANEYTQDRMVTSGWQQVFSGANGTLWLWHWRQGRKENDRSVVVYLRSGNHGVLLTGDLERDGVQRLIEAGIPGPVTLMSLPHHGSARSGSRNLIRILGYPSVIVSSGRENRFGLPAQDLVDFLEDKKVPLWRTDLQGTVQCILKEGEWQARFWNRGVFR